MRIGIISRFPLAESTRWKQDLIDGLLADGHSVFVVFGKKSLPAHGKEALRRATSHKGSRDVRHIAPARIAKILGPVLGKVQGSNDRGHGSSTTSDCRHPTASPGSTSKTATYTYDGHQAGSSKSVRSKRLAAFAKHHNCVVGTFASVNSDEAIAFVTEQKPDLLLLAGAEIVRPPLLAVAARGTLNPHYGPLPKFRGMSAQEWCLYEKIPPAVTIHFVSSGIDTGDIISVTPLPLSPSDSWSDVRQHCQDVACDGLLAAVRAIATDSVTTTAQRVDEGRQYYAMHPRLLARAKQNLESGYWSDTASPTPPARHAPHASQPNGGTP